MSSTRSTVKSALGWGKVRVDATELTDLRGQLAAVDKSLAVIEFSLDGTVLTANQNFLSVVGYRLEEIQGQHHRTFVDPGQHSSDAYRALWEKLRRGEFDSGQYQRLGKGGREIWLQASYNPILSADGVPYKVVKFGPIP